MADDKLNKAHEALETAEAALKLAKQLISEVGDLPMTSKGDTRAYVDKAAILTKSGDGEGRIIEGVFDGQNMLDKKGTVYPVPANYASKSKLVPGDVLKLTVTEEGKFLYKQIGPVERKSIVGPLVYNEGQYQVLADGKAYNVLLASVTYFRAAVGDEVSLIIPMEDKDADWGAIEAVLPKFGEVDEEKITKKMKDELDIEEELDI
ncbi:hypothetical protein KJ742_05525 [Patescibacteria group bacterium]|nr:hypothetical protein [Patescibacteria group bacterium]MBU1683377.1 hypothetical protein [Patescibacteria group bacterium]MBU1935533.1 hypothetical protein [Patescibacteria group bacterium]